MRNIVLAAWGTGLVVAGCVAPPGGPRAPIVLRTQTDVAVSGGTTADPPATAMPTATALSPTMAAITLMSGPVSPWGLAFPRLADATVWQHFGWDGLMNLSLTGAGGGWTGVSGLSAGGLAAAVPVASWDPRRQWATPANGSLGTVTGRETPPGWGDQGWGPTAPDNGTWGQAAAPGQYNLSRGAAVVGGWGLDNGFFTIPQQEKRQQMDTYLQQVNASPNGVPGAGQTKLNQTQFPYLRPVKGPLVPAS